MNFSLSFDSLILIAAKHNIESSMSRAYAYIEAPSKSDAGKALFVISINLDASHLLVQQKRLQEGEPRSSYVAPNYTVCEHA